MTCCIPGANPHADPIEWLECDSCREKWHKRLLEEHKKRTDEYIRDVALPRIQARLAEIARGMAEVAHKHD